MFYVAHRLFGLQDRMFAAIVADRLAAAVGEHSVFLPFCDTDEEALEADVKGRLLFELDSARLGSLRGMIAILHGPSLDDGVCMEVGYARRLGVPVVAMTTDFQTYGLPGDDQRLQFIDPLVETVCSAVVRMSTMAPANDEDESSSRFAEFRRRNERPLVLAAEHAVDVLLAHAGSDLSVRPLRPLADQVFWEPSPYRRADESRPEFPERFVAATRVDTGHGGSVGAVLGAAALDWAEVQRSQTLLVDLDGPETPPGAALMVGCARAQGSQVWGRYASPFVTFAPGREANRRNLMVHYCIDRWL